MVILFYSKWVQNIFALAKESNQKVNIDIYFLGHLCFKFTTEDKYIDLISNMGNKMEPYPKASREKTRIFQMVFMNLSKMQIRKKGRY